MLQVLLTALLSPVPAAHITGLDAVPQLLRLDLSFNPIAAITGLSALTQLEDLSFFATSVTRLEGLEAQVDSLETLSLGRTPLADAGHTLAALRQLRSLRLLGLEGALASIPASEYRSTVLAALPALRFLDWALVTEGERRAAADTRGAAVSEMLAAAAAAASRTSGSHGHGHGRSSRPGGGEPQTQADGSIITSRSLADPVYDALAAGSAAAASASSSARAGGATTVASATGSTGAATARPGSFPELDSVAADAAGVAEAGLQYVAFLWRILNDPVSVSGIPGLGQGAGAAALQKLLAQQQASAAGGSGGPVAAAASARASAPPGSTSARRPGSAAGDGPSAAALERAALRIPGVKERLDAMKDIVDQNVEGALSRGLALHAEQQREVTAASYVLDTLTEASDATARALLSGFARLRKQTVREAGSASGALATGNPGGSAAAAGGAGAATTPGGGGSSGGGARPSSPGASSTGNSSEAAAAEAALLAFAGLREEAVALRTRLVGVEAVLHEQALACLGELDAAYTELSGRRSEGTNRLFRALAAEAMAAAEDAKAAAAVAVDAYAEHAALVAATLGGGDADHDDASGSGSGGAGPVPPGGGHPSTARSTATASAAGTGRRGSLLTTGAATAAGSGAQAAASARRGSVQSRTSTSTGTAGAGGHAASGGAGGAAGRVPGAAAAGSASGSAHGHVAAAHGAGEGGLGLDLPHVDPDVAVLLADRDAAVSAVTVAFEARLARVLAAEDATLRCDRERERRDVKARVVAEGERHRSRAAEIDAAHAQHLADIDALAAAERAVLADED